jgi:hypothetical protein
MPLYEYMCESDGEIITLLRPMRDADQPVVDPRGLGRQFTRQHSTFQVQAPAELSSTPSFSGGCPCGDPNGPCHG